LDGGILKQSELGMIVIEWLRFSVPIELREAFIQKDEEVWTTRLYGFSGFIGKEVWLDSSTSDVVLVVHWSSFEAWHSIPKTEISRLRTMMGDLDLPVVESHAYQVRKFLH